MPATAIVFGDDGPYRERMDVLLISTYELGRQPFGIASPAAVLQVAGHRVTSLDLSVQTLERSAVQQAGLIAVYVPMHTATRIALGKIEQIRSWNPAAHVCAYGLYAPISAETLRALGVDTILGGEFEDELRRLADRLQSDRSPDGTRRGEESGVDGCRTTGLPKTTISLERQRFEVPARQGLPPLEEYAHLVATDGARRTVGYTEASRGCKHLCRHCPVVPVYEGRFRVVPTDIVLADIDQQVRAGARHITFGDPDFLNGPAHATEIVHRLHQEHPQVTYDATIKVEHLLRHADLLPILRDTGCAFVTSAVESVDDDVLRKLEKGHTRADFSRVASLCRDSGLALQPTFVAFTPWITLEGYEDLLATIARLDLVESVPSIQLAIRLLLPPGSRLLELAEVRRLAPELDPRLLAHRWEHPDPRVDALQRDVEALVETAGELANRRELFLAAWDRVQSALERRSPAIPPIPPGRPHATIPYLSEPWYC